MKKRPEQTARTKRDLEQAFWKLYCAKPMEKITVQQICDAAGYNRGTFYLHYHDTYELLESIESRMLDGMGTCVENCMKRLDSDSSKLARVAALGEVIAFYERNKRYIVILLGAQGDPSFILRLKDRLKPLWRTYVIGDTGTHSDPEIDLILEYTLSGSLFMVSRWLQEPGDVNAAQMGHLVYDMSIREASTRARG